MRSLSTKDRHHVLPLKDMPASTRLNALPPALSGDLERLVAANLDRVFTALALTVVRQGRVVLNDSWGWIGDGAPVAAAQPDSLFDLASVTKMFTVSAFLSLAAASGLDLDSPLIALIPEFAVSGPRSVNGGQDPHSKAMLPTPPEREGTSVNPTDVTFRQLLTHTSGLAPWRDVYRVAGPPPAPPTRPEPVPPAVRWARGFEAICGYPFVAQPGQEIRYSDLGLMLLGEAASRLRGAPGGLAAALDDRVIHPLGLRVTFNPVRAGHHQHTTVPTEIDPDWRQRRCWGEVHDENACGLGGIAGHAGLFGGARDVAALGLAWLEDDPRLRIPVSLMNEARKEQVAGGGERRGLGWLLQSRHDSPVGEKLSSDSYGHTGFTGTSLWVDPARQLVIACLTNRVYYGRDPGGIHAFRRALHDQIAEGMSPL